MRNEISRKSIELGVGGPTPHEWGPGYTLFCLSHSKALDKAQSAQGTRMAFMRPIHQNSVIHHFFPKLPDYFPASPRSSSYGLPPLKKGVSHHSLVLFVCKLYKSIYLSNISLQRASLRKHPSTMPSAGMTSHQSHLSCLFHVFGLKY